jgi:hypothetical protein
MMDLQTPVADGGKDFFGARNLRFLEFADA